MVVAAYDVRVNAGGGQYTDGSGHIWQADRAYSAGSWGYTGGGTYSTGSAIAGTTDDPLYQIERWGMTTYRFDVPNGEYDVELRFAEIYCSAVNCRVFSVQLEGVTVVTNLDLFAAVGKNNIYHRTPAVSVSDGTLTITFTASKGSAKINAIHVSSKTTTPATPTRTSTLPSGVTNTPARVPAPLPPHPAAMSLPSGSMPAALPTPMGRGPSGPRIRHSPPVPGATSAASHRPPPRPLPAPATPFSTSSSATA